MGIGIFNQIWAASEVSDQACIAQAIEDAILADELGFDSCWFGEHHNNRHKAIFGRMPIPELLVARLIPQTRRIRLGTGVKLLPLDTPSRTAEVLSTLLALGPGRVELGLGMTMRSDRMAAVHDRGQEFRDRLDELLTWVTPESAHAKPLDQQMTPALPGDVRSLIWVAAREAETIDHVASRGLQLVVGQLEQAVKQRHYVERFAAVAPRGKVRGVRLVHVGETFDQAWRECRGAVQRMFDDRGTTAYGRVAIAEGRLAMTPTDDPREMLRQIDFVAGDPDDVVRGLLDYRETSGVDALDVIMHVPGITASAVQRSMRCFATQVMPHLRTLAGAGCRDNQRSPPAITLP